MMLSCKEVARLLNSDQLDRQSRWTRFLARVHLRMCEHCSRLARQLAGMRAAAKSMTGLDPEPPVEGGEVFEQRLIKKLSERP